jgi:hypothetical protein
MILFCIRWVLQVGGIAQLGEHLLCKQGVIGSIPIVSTTIVCKANDEAPMSSHGGNRLLANDESRSCLIGFEATFGLYRGCSSSV